MNRFEFLAMNNWLRALSQHVIEVKRLRQFSTLPPNKVVLEIGCGNGYGTKLIKQHFKPKKIVALDLDPKMIEVAQRNNRDTSIEFTVGDAATLNFVDQSFDAVFDFGIIHHIPNWKDCLNELKRVLRPGGQIILEDLSTDTFQTRFGRVLRKVLKHPYDEMYGREEFIEYLEKLGFKIIAAKAYTGILHYFIVIAERV